jgi:DNA-binding winged helix-turn-helix (wHTH) protein
MPTGPGTIYRFGQFELDVDAAQLRQNGRRLKLQPQPFKLLVLLIRRAGRLVSRDDIRGELWAEGTFVDFDQAVNFAIKQIRDAMGDSAERPLYIETVPRRGYRFIAPVETGALPAGSIGGAPPDSSTTVRLQKALWTNIAELRLADERRRKRMRIAIAGIVLVLAALAAYLLVAAR